MADPMEATPSEAFDLDCIRSRIRELSEICNEDVFETPSSDSDKLLKDCVLHLESKVKEIVEQYSDDSFLGIENLDEYLEHLKEELNEVEAENAKISDAIEVLSKTNVDESNRLQIDLEGLKGSVDLVSSQGLEKATEDQPLDCSSNREDQLNLIDAQREQNFEILELDSQIEKNKMILKSLQDLDSIFKRFDAVEQIEDAFTGLKVIELEGNNIRLSLQTIIPKLDDPFYQKKFDDIAEPTEVHHELLVEIEDGTMEPKTVEIFPNDIHIADIVDAAKSFRQQFSSLTVLETRSSIGWLVEKVQGRIILSTLRRFIVKNASKFRHSFEYSDKDEMIVAHLLGGVDAFIRVCQGWPLSNSPLKLLSIKNSDNYPKEISLSLLCKVEEMANSGDIQTRQNLSSFADYVEKLLVEQTRLELQSHGAPDK